MVYKRILSIEPEVVAYNVCLYWLSGSLFRCFVVQMLNAYVEARFDFKLELTSFAIWPVCLVLQRIGQLKVNRQHGYTTYLMRGRWYTWYMHYCVTHLPQIVNISDTIVSHCAAIPCHAHSIVYN